MRTRIAIPILLASASVMIAGLSIAAAQPQPNQPGTPGSRPGVPIRPPSLRPPIKQQLLPGQPGGGPGITPAPPGGVLPGPSEPPPPMDPGGGGGGGGARQPIQEFDTGIDYRPTAPGQRVTFNLEDADLPDLVRLISSITGKRFILPGKLRSIKATVYAPTKVSAAEAYQAFLSILDLNGMTVVPAGRYLKIMDTQGVGNQPIPLYTGGSGSPGDDRYITRMHRVSNVASEDVSALLTRFASPQGSVTAYAPTNTVIITDLGSNIRRMLRIVEAIDVPRTGEQIWIEPIHYANASELAARLAEIFPVGQPGGGGGGPVGSSARPARPPRTGPPSATDSTASATAQPDSGGTIGSRGGGEVRVTKILPDERTNSLIIMATERAYLRILEVIRLLDVPLEGEGRIHVHYVQHGDAEDIAGTLQSLVGGGSGGGGGGGGQRPGGEGGAAAGAGGVFEGQIRVNAHKPTNSLVITSSLHDYAALRHVIERLDAPRRQVFIEAVIMELSVRRSSKLGLSFHGGLPDTPTDGALSILGFNAAGSLSPINQESLTGLALGVRGPTIENSQQLIGLSIPAFGVVLNALSTSGDANVLSTPHIIAMDNVEAEINVGENIPLQTSGLPSGLSSLAGLSGLGGASGAQGGLGALGALGGLGGLGAGVPRQDVGTRITITPHINEADEIRMEIQEEISERGATEGDLGVVSITKRMAKTELVVRDQQTVVIGGLMRDSIVTSETKVPILGDIPLLGILFRRTERSTQKTNLLLFLTPYIIRSPADLRSIFERKMRERQEFIDRYFVFGDHDYEPPVDYSRTRGLVGEIINELTNIDIERQLLEEAQARPPPEHVPREPVGSVPEGPGGSGSGDVVITPEGEEQPPPDVNAPPPQDQGGGDQGQNP